MHTARALLDQGESCVLVTQSGAIRKPDFIRIRDEIGKRILIEHLEVSNLSAVLELGKRYATTGIVHLQEPVQGERSIWMLPGFVRTRVINPFTTLRRESRTMLDGSGQVMTNKLNMSRPETFQTDNAALIARMRREFAQDADELRT
jgi:hypothetical protein